MGGVAPEIEFVFLPRTRGSLIKLLRNRLRDGWTLYAINEDRAYFMRAKKREQ